MVAEFWSCLHKGQENYRIQEYLPSPFCTHSVILSFAYTQYKCKSVLYD
jgi:hypothetical protein